MYYLLFFYCNNCCTNASYVHCLDCSSCSCSHHPTVFHFFRPDIIHSAQKAIRNTCANLYMSFYRRIIALAFKAEYLTLTSTEMEEYTDNHMETLYFVC